mgnify:FL=1
MLRFFAKNMNRSLITHWKANLLILADLILCALMIFIMLQNYSFASYEYRRYFRTEGLAQKYKVFAIEDEMQREPFNKKSPMYEATLCVKEEIENSYLWTPYYFLWLELPREIFVDELSSDFEVQFAIQNPQAPGNTNISGIEISEHLLTLQNIKIHEGWAFTHDDYDVISETCPIIMGYDFIPYYDVGDIIIFENRKAEVVGFLEDNAFLEVDEADMFNLDRQVILPRLFFLDENETMSDSDSLLLLTGGILSLKDPKTDVQEEINKITSKYGWYPIKCIPFDGSAYSNTGIVSQKNIALLLFLAIVSGLLCLVALSNILYKRTMKERPTHCTMLLTGIPLWKINLSLVIEMAFWTGLAIVPVVILSYYEFGRMYVSPFYVLSFMGLIAAISMIPVFVLNGKTNLDVFMRSRNE